MINVILMYSTLTKTNYTFHSWYLYLIFLNTNKDYMYELTEDCTLLCLRFSHQVRNKLHIEKCMYLKF